MPPPAEQPAVGHVAEYLDRLASHVKYGPALLSGFKSAGMKMRKDKSMEMMVIGRSTH